MTDWHQDWFNKDYLKLYAHRDDSEAKAHVTFIQKVTALSSGRVLDMGCGAGRHTIPFAEKGFDVVGVDASETLLDEARKRAGDYDIKFIQADFRNLPQIGQFDLVLSLFTSFGYFATDDENREILSIAKRHLKPEGLFFLDFLDPQTVKSTLVPEESKTIDGEHVKITRAIEADMVVKKISFPTRVYEERVKLYSKNQILTFCDAAGFKLVDFWSQYDSQTQQRQLFLFKT